jgi:hypothetical protein
MTRFQTALVFGILALNVAAAYGQEHSAPSSAPHQATRKSQRFLDYTLGKINPDNKDYGLSAEGARTGVVHDSIDDLYFWSNLVTLSLLSAVTVIRFLEQRSAEKKEVICAALVTQLWNGRVSTGGGSALQELGRSGLFKSLTLDSSKSTRTRTYLSSIAAESRWIRTSSTASDWDWAT